MPNQLLLDRRRGGGFTLIEILVVVTIIGILAVLIVPKVMNRPDEARVVAARHGISAIMLALRMYKMDNMRYPTTEQGLQALVTKPTIPPIPPNWKGYLDNLPMDPWGHPYQYLQPGLHGDVDVFSYGADGVPGGEENDADIGSWQQ
ncbi:MAG TPA: type II secretion system major pseudopilin GspG [Gallionellaceae bacterium]|nr:type II secretion system major pseudopilin GspG [Gallionellaceae bacterium]